ncbi:MAG: beta strand repeat-containing protein [Bacteroidia bacterium]
MRKLFYPTFLAFFVSMMLVILAMPSSLSAQCSSVIPPGAPVAPILASDVTINITNLNDEATLDLSTKQFNSITIAGEPNAFTDLLVPDFVTYSFSTPGAGKQMIENGVNGALLGDPGFDAELIAANTSRNLNFYFRVDNNVASTDYVNFSFNNAIASARNRYVIVTERLGNNDMEIQAIDAGGSLIGTPRAIDNVGPPTTTHIATGQNNDNGQEIFMTIYPLTAFVGPNVPINGVRLTQTGAASLSGDGGDGKIFIVYDPFFLTPPPTILLTTSSTQPTCPSGLGTITINALDNGGGALEYSINGNAGPWRSANTFTPGPGTYTVAVRYAANPSCLNTSSSSITLNPNPGCPDPCAVSPFTASITGTGNITCANPAVTLTASPNITVNYDYAWTGPGSFTSADPSVIATVSGTYEVTITHKVTSCFEVATHAIAVDTVPPTVFPASLSLCASAAGGTSANFTLTDVNSTVDPGGTLTLSYHATAALARTGGSPLSSPYPSGSTTVYARAVNTTNGCDTIAPVTLTVIAKPVASPGALAVCSDAPGGNTGTFILTTLNTTVGSASDVITYHNSQSDADNDVTALPTPYTTTAKTIFARVENGSTNCYSTSSVTLTVHTTPNLSASVGNICTGTGGIDLTTLVTDASAAGGTLTAHSTLAAANSGTPTIATTQNPSAGTTTYYIRKTTSTSPACFDIVPVTVNVTTQPTAGTGSSTNRCAAASGISLIALESLLTGETSGGAWTSTGAAAGANFNAATGELDPNGLAPATYTFLYTASAPNCTDDTEPVSVVILETPDLQDASTTICNNPTAVDLNTLVTDLNSAGGSVSFYSSLANANNGSPTIGATPSPTSTTTYYVRKNTATSPVCFDIAAITVNVNQPANAGTATDIEVCEATLGATVVTLSNQVAGEDAGGAWTSIAGTPGANFDAANGTFDPNGLAAGDYTFRYTVTGAAPCANDTEDLTITINPTPDLSLTPATLCNTGSQSIDLETLVTDNASTTGTVTYYTSLGDAQAPTGAITSTVMPTSTTIFYIRKQTANGCFDISGVVITVNQPVTAGTGSSTSSCAVTSGGAIIDLATLLTGESAGGAWTIATGAPGANFDAFTGTLDPNGLAAGTYSFTYTVTGTAPCGNDDENVTVTIHPVPDLVTTPASMCNDGTSDVNLATLVTDNNTTGGLLTYYTTLGAAQAETGALATAVVEPTTTTTYYIRSETTNGCFDITTEVITVFHPVTAGSASN